jgi:hypothetical protein
LWGGRVVEHRLATPAAPTERTYAVVTVGVQGDRTPASPPAAAGGLATLRWDSVAGGDAYVILRDGREVAGPIRIEGSQNVWADTPKK